ncbi:isocitrate lyase/phosphoenolpyruvate mutase family protein [Ramlibacter sp.]|uniref:isocitrate lyase/PEP mutase family protein n=1 Tax=Ramlibacter sp. TaxID=1917967 RepID=UPI002633A626|nr:isocitrate lyase/phosphoenolpyruvate mutase family protein [Ramlibacter sp.]MDB5956462.1 2-methylisocitrate lyase [Ramlibacter sp.]
MSDSVQAKRAAFRALHEQGCFVLPNPWDVGSARMLQGLGFQALATTSSGHAWSLGRPDGTASRAAILEHVRSLVEATELPVNLDFEDGFAQHPEGVAESVRLAIATGVAGVSIEDSTGDPAQPVRDLDDSIARVRAARSAIDASGEDVLLVGRAENFFLGRPDLADTIKRLQAYAEAGADCLYAPGIRTREQIAAVVAAVAPRPVNLLVGSPIGLTLAEIAELGVRRISIGGGLARAAWGGFLRAARSIAQEGRFDALGEATPGTELNTFFRQFADHRA